MKVNKRVLAFTIAIVLAVSGITVIAQPNAPYFKITNSTTEVYTVDYLGHVNQTGNLQIGGDVFCSDCIGDADVSNTLTCSDLVAASEVVADSEVANDLVIDGGTINLTTCSYTGTLGIDNLSACADTEIIKYNSTSAAWECESDDAGVSGNSTEEMQDAVLNALSGDEGITYAYNDAINFGNITFDCSEVTDSGSDHLSCSSEDIVVDDDFLLNTGDTLTTADLQFDGTNMTDSNSNAEIRFDGTGGVTIHLQA